MATKQWRVRPTGTMPDASLIQSLQLTPLLANVLAARGNHTEEAASLALFPQNAPLGDPFSMADMDKACARLHSAIENKEKITVFGDYDVDGVTASFLLISYLRGKGVPCESYIPERTEGYGLSVSALTQIAQTGTSLVISVDAGITAVEEAKHAKALGMALIITDHHQCGDVLPDAVAVLNPRRSDCRYPCKELAGVGVAFTLLRGMEGDDEAVFARYGDAVALGTLADVMPLVGENKRLVGQGMGLLCQTENKGLCALIQESGTSPSVSPMAVSFSLAPRINAAGRMASAQEALDLFLSETEEEAQTRAKALCDWNVKRRETESKVFESAKEMMEENWGEVSENKAIVLCSDQWHPGTIGIVSARLAELYGFPVVLAVQDGDTVKGSARSVAGFDLYDALCRACEGLGQCGGHEMAAGLTMDKGNFAAFRNAFYTITKNELQEGIGPVLEIDCRIAGDLLTEENVTSLERLSPFGAGNPQPVFAMLDVTLRQVVPLSGGKHVKLMLETDDGIFQGLCFGLRADALRFRPGDRLDVAFCAEINRYRGQVSVQLTVQDLRPFDKQRAREKKAETQFASLLDDAPITLETRHIPPPPQRAVLASVWRGLLSLAQGRKVKASPALLYCRARNEADADGLDELSVMIALDAFSEAGLIRRQTGKDGTSAHFNQEQSISFCKTDGEKVDLTQTRVMRKLQTIS